MVMDRVWGPGLTGDERWRNPQDRQEKKPFFHDALLQTGLDRGWHATENCLNEQRKPNRKKSKFEY